MLLQIKLPEFSRNRTIDSHKALVFNSPCRYDVILGADFLRSDADLFFFSQAQLAFFFLKVFFSQIDGNKFSKVAHCLTVTGVLFSLFAMFF
jgi:hypothetical protein